MTRRRQRLLSIAVAATLALGWAEAAGAITLLQCLIERGTCNDHLATCNAKDPSQPKPPTPQAEDREPASVIPQAQQDALNKARNVEAVLQQGAKRNDVAE